MILLDSQSWVNLLSSRLSISLLVTFNLQNREVQIMIHLLIIEWKKNYLSCICLHLLISLNILCFLCKMFSGLFVPPCSGDFFVKGIHNNFCKSCYNELPTTRFRILLTKVTWLFLTQHLEHGRNLAHGPLQHLMWKTEEITTYQHTKIT